MLGFSAKNKATKISKLSYFALSVKTWVLFII